MNLRTILALVLGLLMCAFAPALTASPNSGRISGIVLDPSGTPQMGANVWVFSEQLPNSSETELFTNQHGHFSTPTLPVGVYSIKVTLAGFLPTMERHIQVGDQRTTVLEVVLGSVLSSFENLRQQPHQSVAKDDWTWVLRGSPATRSVLQWGNGKVVVLGEEAQGEPRQQEHEQLVLSSGSDHPGSIGAEADSPGTAFLYDVGVGDSARLLMAGQFSYEGGAVAEGFAGEWLPSGRTGVGPVTTLVLRQSHLGPSGPTFRGLRMSHDDQIALSTRVALRYGSELVVAGMLGKTMTSLRPRTELGVQLGRGWEASAMVATRPWDNGDNATTTGDAALHALDEFPTILLRHGRPIIEDNLHEEIAIEHGVGTRARISAAFFHDASNHTAVMGRGGAADAPDFLQDYFSQAFAYDGGSSNSSGGRLAYSEKFGNSLSTTVVYAYAGALAPTASVNMKTLRGQLSTQDRQSLAGRVSATVPRAGTKFTAGYQWLSGPTLSRLDSYGDSAYHLDPYLGIQVRQPIPTFFSGHLEVEADAGNLLAQGYVPIETARGRVILVPSYRYFRGGLSFQF